MCSTRAPLTALFVVISTVACGPPPLAHGQSSADRLAGGVVSALERRDGAALRALALSEEEFRQHVWPSLPAARPERNLPFGYVWGDLRQKSESSLEATLARHGGQHLELAGVSFAGPTTEYAGFRVHRDAVFRVKNPSGVESETRVCGSFLEKDGVWKVFSYVVAD
jgi:hypothetical protein